MTDLIDDLEQARPLGRHSTTDELRAAVERLRDCLGKEDFQPLMYGLLRDGKRLDEIERLEAILAEKESGS